MQQPTRLLPPRPLFAEALVWTGVVACVAGMSTSGLWRQLPLDRFGEILLLAGVSALLAWPLQRWRGWSWASSLGLAWLFALVAFTGLLPALAVALLVAAAIGIGGLIMGDTRCLPALLSAPR